MRAILDEQLSPQIAVLLRQAGYYVDAVADRVDLVGRRFAAMRLAVPRAALRWGHGDGLVLQGLSELPVILSP